MPVTQQQIASRMGISRSLVARALKGHTEVAEATRQLVQQTALEMGYNDFSNREARALASHRYGHRLKRGIFAITSPATDNISPRYLPFFAPFLEGVEAEAARLEVDLCLCSIRDYELPRLIRDRGVDGVITLGNEPPNVLAMRELDIPVITFHSRMEEAHSIIPDDIDGARQLTNYLIEQGHEKIAFIGVPDDLGQHSKRRFRGFKEVMQQHGLAVPDEWTLFYRDLPFATQEVHCHGCGNCAACAGLSTLIEQSGGLVGGKLPFTAVICHNDPIAMGVVMQAESLGFAVPDDLSVVGFDHVSSSYRFNPEITSVSYSRYAMGRRAVNILREHIEKQDASEEAPIQHCVFPMDLTIHASSGKNRES